MVMAPMTRSRAREGNVPNALAATYYVQRAWAGLIVTEATRSAPQGVGYIRTPGIHSDEQVAGWKQVTEAVHARRRPDLRAALARRPHVAPDLPRRRVAGGAIGSAGRAAKPYPERPKPVADAARAGDRRDRRHRRSSSASGAENAKAAGFDGVEMHGANGYLLDQFLRDGTNQRTDAYGGAIENRARLSARSDRRRHRRVGAGTASATSSRPIFPAYSMSDSDPIETVRFHRRGN